MKKRNTLLLLLLLSLVVPNQLLAVELPAIVGNYFDVVIAMLNNYIVLIVIAFILLYGGYNYFANDNIKALKNAIFASLFIAGASMFGPSIVDYMQSTNNGFTGTDSFITAP